MPSIWGPVAGFVGSQLVGFIWYSPYLFGPRWVRMVHPGKTWDQLKESSTPSMLVALVSHAVLAGFLNHIYLDHWGVTDMCSTLRAGLAISGIGALSEVCHVMFAEKPLALFAIDSGFNTAVILAISAGIGFFI